MSEHRRPPPDEAAGGVGLFARVAQVSARWPWLVIIVWVSLAVGLTVSFPSLGLLAQKAPAAILPPTAPSMVSQQQMTDDFKEASSFNILLVVMTNDSGLGPAEENTYRDLAYKLRAENRDVAAVQDFLTTPALREVLVSKDRRAWMLPVNVVGEFGSPDALEATKRIISTVKDTTAGTSTTTFVSGPAGTVSDVQDIGERDRVRIEAATVISLLTILLIVYRNIVTMVLPLITIVVSLVAAQGAVAGLGVAGLDISNQTIVLLTAMLSGAGTDYAVFLISRYHDFLRQGVNSDRSVHDALVSVGPVITASAATVAVTFMGMVFTRLTIFSTVGIALAMAIFVGCLGAVTFLPSMLVLAGRRGWINPSRDLTSRLWKRSGIRIVRRPVTYLVGSLAILAILASSSSLAIFTYDDRKAMPTSSESIRGYDVISDHFASDASLPQYILIRSPDDLRTPQALADLDQMAQRISQLPDIDLVRGITRPTGATLDQAKLSFQAGEVGKPLNGAAGVINGNAASLDLLVYGAVQVANALDAVRGQFEPTAAALNSLLPSLAYLQNQYGTGKALPGFNLPGDPLNTIHGLGGSMGRIGDTVAAADGSIGPVLNVLNGNPVCDADPTCVAARARLQQSYDARNKPTSTTPTATPTGLPAEVPATPQPTPATTTAPSQSIPGKEKPEPSEVMPVPTAAPGTLSPAMGGALNSIGENLRSTGITSPADLANRLNQLQQGIDMLAQASRQVAIGVSLLVNQTKRLGVGLEQASSFLLSMRRDATTPSMAGFYIPPQVLTQDEFKKAAAIFISPDGHAVRYLVQTKLNPFSEEAMDQVEDILATAHGAQPNTTLADATISMNGFPSSLRDTREDYYHDLRLIVLTTILVVFGILCILLRALVAPLYLIVSVMLSYLSALGLGVLLFRFILGQDLHWSLPGLTFIILVAVGADYNLLLISRIREEAPRGLRSGVVRTITQTGGVITAAGLIFAASMLGLQFASITTLVQIGFIIGVGILLDTFLVRTITVPAMAVLVGKANWWPSRE